MADLVIRSDPDRLRRDGGGTITGPICVRFGDLAFPQEDYEDQPVILLAWWARECPLVRDRELATFPFMDGSLVFSLRPEGDKDTLIQFTREGDADDPAVIASGRVDPQRVVSTILEAGRRTLSACRERSWSSEEIDELAAAIEDASRGQMS